MIMMTTKHWFKKILSIIILSTLLVACSMMPTVSETQDEIDSKLSGTIIFLQSFTNRSLKDKLIYQYRESFNQYIKKFTKIYPQVKIIVEFTEDEQFIEELKKDVEKGLGADLIFTQLFKTIPLLRAGTIRPIDKYSIDLLQFRPEAIIQALYQGKLYGIPFILDTQVLCYNKDKVDELPKTLSELTIQARKGYSVGMVSAFRDTLWGSNIFGGRILDSQGNINLGQGNGWIEWIKWLKNARNEPNFIFNEDSFVLQNAFVENQLAYNVCWSDQIPFLRDSLGSDKFGIALLPGGENGQAAPPLIASGFLFSSASSPNQTKIALKFAQFLANTQVQTELTAKYRSFIPANKNATIDSRLFPIQGILQEQSQTAVKLSLDQTEKVDYLTNYAKDFYTRVMAGEISAEQAASELSKIVNSQLE